MKKIIKTVFAATNLG